MHHGPKMEGHKVTGKERKKRKSRERKNVEKQEREKELYLACNEGQKFSYQVNNWGGVGGHFPAVCMCVCVCLGERGG